MPFCKIGTGTSPIPLILWPFPQFIILFNLSAGLASLIAFVASFFTTGSDIGLEQLDNWLDCPTNSSVPPFLPPPKCHNTDHSFPDGRCCDTTCCKECSIFSPQIVCSDGPTFAVVGLIFLSIAAIVFLGLTFQYLRLSKMNRQEYFECQQVISALCGVATFGGSIGGFILLLILDGFFPAYVNVVLWFAYFGCLYLGIWYTHSGMTLSDNQELGYGFYLLGYEVILYRSDDDDYSPM